VPPQNSAKPPQVNPVVDVVPAHPSNLQVGCSTHPGRAKKPATYDVSRASLRWIPRMPLMGD